MTQAFATRMPRGFSWVWLAIVAVALRPSSLVAQGPPAAKDDKKAAAAAAVQDEPADDPEPTSKEQVFIDPNAKKSLAVFNPLNYSGPTIRIAVSGDDRAKIRDMAGRLVNIDPEFLKNFVQYFAVELTKRDNLKAVLDPPANLKPDAARGLEKAVDALNKPVIDGRANDNKEFLSAYYRALFESSLPKLLEPTNNYLTRIDAMIVLGMAGNPGPAALDLYIAQIKKPDQLIWVKLWAARGLTIAAQQGAVDLDAAKANLATEALVGMLSDDPKLPWPVQMRAIEAIGSLRVATVNSPRGKVDAASVVLQYLANPEASPMVRAWAAWALGSLKVPANVTPYNFALVGHEVGELTVDLGNRIVQDFDDNPADFDKAKDLTAQMTALLIFQVCPSLIGVEGVRDSGLLRSPHKNAAEDRPFLTKLADKVKAVSRSANDLLKTAGAGNKPARNDLDAKLADLKTLLAGNAPKTRRLIPGGPEFTPNPAEQVAGAPRKR